MRGISVESSPCLGPASQIFTFSEISRPHSSQNSLYSPSNWPDAPPQSPLTDSTISSQESSAAELVESGAAQSILGLGSRFNEGPLSTYDSLSTHSSYERTSNLARSYPELSSPPYNIQSSTLGQKTYPNAFPGDVRPSFRGRTSSFRTLFEQVSSINPGQSLIDIGMPEPALTVEHLVAVIRNLPANQAVIPAVAPGLKYMDSRAVAFLLKDIAKNGLPHRAVEIFDWLRKQPASHELSRLCDVYTYTTVIALCGQRQSLVLAMELVAEMRGRGIPCNVHTYSALMNTCIKCGELEVALDVFGQLKSEGCTANVVTYNTLVDVFGKLGRWQEAIKVIDEVYQQGMKPEVRTFNTVIIAANMCNQPAEALKVYDRMLKSGYTPTATTYTALISSYGKAGQLDRALEIFQLMVQKGLDRNVITYSSLILASDRAGRWQLALDLLNEMKRDRITPNTSTFNSLMSACAQGAQSEKAEEIFQSMLSKRCKPNVATYSALLLAHIQADQWRAALQAWNAMQAANNPPEPALYASLIQCLWDSGVVSAQGQAAKLFTQGCRSGAVARCIHQTVGPDQTLEVFISAPNSSIAILAFHRWLREAQEKVSVKGRNCLGQTIQISTGSPYSDSADQLQSNEGHHTSTVLFRILECMGSPFRVIHQGPAPMIVCDAWNAADWLLKKDVKAALADIIPLPSTEGRSGRDSYTTRNIAAVEASLTLQFKETQKHFLQVETHQEALLAAALPCYTSPREDFIHLATTLADCAKMSSDLVYTAMVFLDCALVAGVTLSKTNSPPLIAACLLLSAQKCTRTDTVAAYQKQMEATLTSHGSLGPILDRLSTVGVFVDAPVACPLAALQQYQGYFNQDLAIPDHLNKPDVHGSPNARAKATHGSRALLAKAMLQGHCQHIRPSLLAAAALSLERRTRGMNPPWPNPLAKWTGISGPGSPDFEAALQAVVPAVGRG